MEVFTPLLMVGMTIVVGVTAIIAVMAFFKAIENIVNESNYGLYIKLGIIFVSIIVCAIIDTFCSVPKNASLLLKIWIVINCCALPLLALREFKRY